jgi:hypothetical protein
MDHIEIMSVVGELEMTGCGLEFRVENRTLLDLAGNVIEGINVDVIHAKVCHTQIFVVSGHFHALHMRPEIALRNASQSLEEELIRDLTDTSVFAQPQNGDLAVMVTADKEIFVIIIRGKM